MNIGPQKTVNAKNTGSLRTSKILDDSEDELNSEVDSMMAKKNNEAKSLINDEFTLSISQDEWKKANEFFKKNPTEFKLSKKNKNYNGEHSFIQINNVIYALADGEYIGEGSEGRVKIAQNEKEEAFALKIEGVNSTKIQTTSEIEILQLLGEFCGRKIRVLPAPREFRKKMEYSKEDLPVVRNAKRYTLKRLHKGPDLFEYLRSFNPSERDLLALAYECCEEIERLHNLGIIHGDIKVENLIKTNNGIKAIDFAFSLHIQPPATSVIIKEIRGTYKFVAPEIIDSQEYSVKSDIYALGAMLKYDFLLNADIYQDVYIEDPAKRISINALKDKIKAQIAKLDNIEAIKRTPKIADDSTAAVLNELITETPLLLKSPFAIKLLPAPEVNQTDENKQEKTNKRKQDHLDIGAIDMKEDEQSISSVIKKRKLKC